MGDLEILLAEHATLRPHLTEIRNAASQGSDEELSQALSAASTALTSDLDGHIALEDQGYFPKVAALLADSIVEPFVAEHREIEQARDAVYGGDLRGDALLRGCLTLCALLEDHIAKEETMLFPAARDA